jgi:predicted small secreted protein
MMKTLMALLLVAFCASACNTFDGLVTDVDHGVDKIKNNNDRR